MNISYHPIPLGKSTIPNDSTSDTLDGKWCNTLAHPKPHPISLYKDHNHLASTSKRRDIGPISKLPQVLALV